MKQYLLSIYQPDAEPPPPEALAAVMRDVNAMVDEAKTTGAWVFNGGLHSPSTSTVVRVERGDLLITDGPYVESKEHIGGFLIVRALDLDGALYWAERLAQALTVGEKATGLAVEVRPFQGEA
jgi:hypothetical protein